MLARLYPIALVHARLHLSLSVFVRVHSFLHVYNGSAGSSLSAYSIELHASLGHVPRSNTNSGVTVNPKQTRSVLVV